jgi:hypothetical protein
MIFLMGKNKKKKKNHRVQLKINNVYLRIKKWYIYVYIKKKFKKIIIINITRQFFFSIGLNFNRLI